MQFCPTLRQISKFKRNRSFVAIFIPLYNTAHYRNKYVRLRGLTYPHMPIVRPLHTQRDHVFGSQRVIVVNVVDVVACWPIRRPIWGFWGSKVHKNGRFPALDADEPPAKFDAASFVLGGEIRNCTTHKKQTVNDISTHCLTACVDKNMHPQNRKYITYRNDTGGGPSHGHMHHPQKFW